MSTILSLETSSEIASVALLCGQKIIERQAHGVMNHSQSILPMVQSVLQEAKISLSGCEAIAVGCGPGSFTGVRTACGVAQGLAFGAALPLIPVVTLLALAEACRYHTGAVDVVSALDARMGEVYWAQYHFDTTQQIWVTRIEPALCAPAELVFQPTDGVRLVGNGFTSYAGQFKFKLSCEQPSVPDASAIARLAQIELTAGRIYPPEQAQPLYLRNKVALTIAERKVGSNT